MNEMTNNPDYTDSEGEEEEENEDGKILYNFRIIRVLKRF